MLLSLEPQRFSQKLYIREGCAHCRRPQGNAVVETCRGKLRKPVLTSARYPVSDSESAAGGLSGSLKVVSNPSSRAPGRKHQPYAGFHAFQRCRAMAPAPDGGPRPTPPLYCFLSFLPPFFDQLAARQTWGSADLGGEGGGPGVGHDFRSDRAQKEAIAAFPIIYGRRL